MTTPRAETLFHFTKSLDVLRLILQGGFAPRFCLEDVKWQNIDEKHIAYAMTCFCDIPLSRITEHTSFYGQYGLGMTKEWGLKNGLNPVMYFPENGYLPQLATFLLKLNLKKTMPDSVDELDVNIFNLLKLMKPIKGTMVVSGSVVEKDFYQECEWRYAPLLDELIFKSTFDEERDAANKKAEEYAIKFVPSDVRYIFVPTDADIPPLVDFINNNLGQYPHNDIKILQTRIVSLSTIEADM